MKKCIPLLLLVFNLMAEKNKNAPPVTINVDGGTVINTLSDFFYGHNYWMWCKSWKNDVAGTESLVSEMGVKFLRFGGANADIGSPDDVTDEVLDDFAKYCTAIKAEPLLQLQLAKYTNTIDRVSNASSMFTRFKGMKPTKYVSIGNEPDIYPENMAASPVFKAEYLKDYSLDDYCTDYNAVAAEIKKKDPSVKLIGLELSWKRDAWVPGFVAKCKDNIDMISLHYYPFEAQKCTYVNAGTEVSNVKSFYDKMRKLIDKNAGGKQIPLIIGETNITWDGDPKNSIYPASPGTFLAALCFADFVGVSSAQKNLFSIMPWSIREGWSLAFLDSQKKPKPVYHIYKMFAQNSKKHLICNQSPNAFLRTYGYKDDQNNVSLFTVNWDTVSSYDATIQFSNILKNSSYKYIIPPSSVSCLTFSSDFSDIKITNYSRNMSEPFPVAVSTRVTLPKMSEISFSLNKCRSVLEIYSPKEINAATLTIMNLQGKVLGKTTLVVNCGKTDIRMPFRSLTSGVYLLRLTDNKIVLSEERINW